MIGITKVSHKKKTGKHIQEQYFEICSFKDHIRSDQFIVHRFTMIYSCGVYSSSGFSDLNIQTYPNILFQTASEKTLFLFSFCNHGQGMSRHREKGVVRQVLGIVPNVPVGLG